MKNAGLPLSGIYTFSEDYFCWAVNFLVRILGFLSVSMTASLQLRARGSKAINHKASIHHCFSFWVFIICCS